MPPGNVYLRFIGAQAGSHLTRPRPASAHVRSQLPGRQCWLSLAWLPAKCIRPGEFARALLVRAAIMCHQASLWLFDEMMMRKLAKDSHSPCAARSQAFRFKSSANLHNAQNRCKRVFLVPARQVEIGREWVCPSSSLSFPASSAKLALERTLSPSAR